MLGTNEDNNAESSKEHNSRSQSSYLSSFSCPFLLLWSFHHHVVPSLGRTKRCSKRTMPKVKATTPQFTQ